MSEPSQTKVTGHLQIRNGSRGRVWHALYRVNGRRHHTILGPAHVRDSGRRSQKGRVIWRAAHGAKPTAAHLTPPEAQHALDELLAEVRLERIAIEVAGEVEPEKTFGDAWREWLRHVEFDKQRKASTLSDYRSQTRCYLVEQFGDDTPLSEITTERIEEWQQELLESGRLSRRTVQKAQVLLFSILKRAKKKRWIDRNPAEDADRITLKRSGDFNVLSPEDADALVRAAANETDAALYRTAVGTGLRMGELRALRWRDVDFGRRVVHVRWAFARQKLDRPKSSSVRSVPMADQVAVALDGLSRRERFVGPEDFVFCTDIGTRPDDGRTRRDFYAALERAGLGHLRTQQHPIRFHDLRHTFGTLAVQAAPISDVQAWMGHAHVQTTEIYVHYVPQHDAADRLSKVFAGSAHELRSEPTEAVAPGPARAG